MVNERCFWRATQSSQKTELPRHSHTSTILMEREKSLKDIFKVSKTQDHLGIQSQFSKNRHQNQPFSIRLPSARRMWLTISVSHSVHPLPVSHMCNKTAFNKDGCLPKVGHCRHVLLQCSRTQLLKMTPSRLTLDLISHLSTMQISVDLLKKQSWWQGRREQKRTNLMVTSHYRFSH